MIKLIATDVSRYIKLSTAAGSFIVEMNVKCLLTCTQIVILFSTEI